MAKNSLSSVLSNYSHESPAVRTSLYEILSAGRLGGSGRLLILPVDQGFEHGPDKSFSKNAPAYDPLYHHQLAVDAGLSAYAAPLGMLEASVDEFCGMIPLILKITSANTLTNASLSYPTQSVNASVADAIRLGCKAVGFTIYPGSSASYDMIEIAKEMAEEAKDAGLAVVIWSYPRGESIEKADESALDVIAYSAHIAALLGANIIKVKIPSDRVSPGSPISAIHDMPGRIAHIMQASFAGRRLVIFSGGTSKSLDNLYEEARAIRSGGGSGSIIGRNTFQRPREEAMVMLDNLISIYL